MSSPISESARARRQAMPASNPLAAPRRRDLAWLGLTLLAVAAVYWPPRIGAGQAQLAIDFTTLHARRLAFARDALFGPAHALPAWYPAEAMGTPFWSNLQNFPFLPTRLALLPFDPLAPYTYGAAVIVAAMLAALCTFGFARRLGLRPLAAATAGWTFAASGFFASRVAAGHLPLLELYFALPALLWAVEALAQDWENEKAGRLPAAALALTCTCIALGGHPQLPAYALAAALAYGVWRVGLRRAARIAAQMALGIGMAGFALVPMAKLIARSTRVLALAPAKNDLALPVERLPALLLPWIDGAAAPLTRSVDAPFTGAGAAVFWDTNGYAGMAPWLALAALAAIALRRGRSASPHASRPVLFLVALGLAALVLALPWLQQLTARLSVTLLRSPARLLYLTGFALALAFGFAVHWLLDRARTRFAAGLVGAVLALHGLDLGRHTREYLLAIPTLRDADLAPVTRLLAQAGKQRVAVDHALPLESNRRSDDVGFFDSIVLARPYRAMLDLASAPEDLNLQALDGSSLPLRALQALGASLVVTTRPRNDLAPLARAGPIAGYAVPAAATRATFFPLSRVRFAAVGTIHRSLRDPGADVLETAWIPTEAPPQPRDLVGEAGAGPNPRCERPAPDRILCATSAPGDGYLRLLESFDPGWSATVDGAPIEPVAESDAWLAVALGPGDHEVEFQFRTPGAAAGLWLSILSFVGMLLVVWRVGLPPKKTTAS